MGVKENKSIANEMNIKGQFITGLFLCERKGKNMSEISWNDFLKVELRAGTIVKTEEFPEARNPAYKIWVDFGEDIGVKKSSAQVTKLYAKEELVGKQVICVTNFPKKQVGPLMSECLVTGFVLEDGEVVLSEPERKVPNGTRLA